MDQAEAKAKYQQANELYRAGTYAEALALLDDLSAAFPQHKDILFAKAQCLQKLGRRDDLLVVIGQLQAAGDSRAEALRAGLAEVGKATGRSVPKRRVAYALAGLGCLAAIVAGGLFLRQQSGAGTTVQRHESTESNLSVVQNQSVAHAPAAPLDAETAKPANDTTHQPSTAPTPSKVIFPEPVFCKARDEWDLDKEVARVMLDPRIPDTRDPKWNRESYQDIIDAAREARLNGRKTTIHVPGNITGKDTLRILYASAVDYPAEDSFQVIWGNDEDIVFITSRLSWGRIEFYETSPGVHLQILPGTIVLFAAMNNDDVGGKPPEHILKELLHYESIYKGEWTPDPVTGKSTTDKPENKLYHMMRDENLERVFPLLHNYGGLTEVRGTRETPILMCSDAPPTDLTCVDWRSLSFSNGIVDCAIILDCANFNSLTSNTLVSRTLPEHHQDVAIGASGFVIGNRIETSLNESIGSGPHHPRENIETCRVEIAYNVAWTPTIGARHTRVINNRILAELGIGNNISDGKYLTISRNNFIRPLGTSGYGYFIVNQVDGIVGKVDLSENYWLDNFWNHLDNENFVLSTRFLNLRKGGLLEDFDFSDPLTSPDSDLDGLTDEEENQYGTHPQVMDTDGDGCIDGLEVNEYTTDPLKFTTDGDGIPDGLEVYIKTNALDAASFTPIGKSGDRFYDQMRIASETPLTAKPEGAFRYEPIPLGNNEGQ